MPRCRRQVLLESALQMRLIGKPRLQCHLGDRPATAQLRPRLLHPLVEQIAMGRQAEALAERANQVGAGQPASRADIRQAQRVAAVRTNECRCRCQLRMFAWRLLRTAVQIPGKIREKSHQARFSITPISVEQVGKQLQQPAVQPGRRAEGLGGQDEATRPQPRHVDEQHQV